MSSVERLLLLFRAHREKDETAFYKAAESLIADELAANHHSSATELQKALGQPKQVRNSANTRNGLSALPKDRRSGEMLVTFDERPIDATKLTLCPATARQLERLVEEHRQRLRLARYGYQPKSKVLLWGPPGCGKTLAAHHIAGEFGLPLGLVRLSALISSYLGDTATHIQRVFDVAKSNPMVLLLDEADAVGKNRNDPNDVGELKRVVNGLLQAMDSFFSTESVVIAASNHQYLLDPALWRRFDDIIHFPMPGIEERNRFLQRLLNGVEYKGSPPALAKKMSRLSFASIERVVVESVKTMILQDRKELRTRDVIEQLKLFQETLCATKEMSLGANHE
ncbi:MAG: ATP-binding protein [Planctomycetes bacterium]|nr:ATP-binding protein [Planctomycetota bacterium]